MKINSLFKGSKRFRSNVEKKKRMEVALKLCKKDLYIYMEEKKKFSAQ